MDEARINSLLDEAWEWLEGAIYSGRVVDKAGQTVEWNASERLRLAEALSKYRRPKGRETRLPEDYRAPVTQRAGEG